MALSQQCQNGRCNECPEILANGERCEHAHHINTADTSADMDKSLKQQQADQENEETITLNDPHIL